VLEVYLVVEEHGALGHRAKSEVVQKLDVRATTTMGS